MGHIFISYARTDWRWVARIRKEIAKAQRKDWLDVDDIEIGGDWRHAIDQALRDAAGLVVILSPVSTKSEYVTYEWAFALGAGIPVIPVVVKACELHPRLAALQHLDFTTGTPRWGRLIDGLRSPRKVLDSSFRDAQAPMILAEFELDGHKIVKAEDSYRLLISTKHVPTETKRVTYEIVDETYEDDERIFNVGSDREDFKDSITSYGDIFLTAKGKSPHGAWRTQSTLAEALRRKYGPHPLASIQQALNDIERN